MEKIAIYATTMKCYCKGAQFVLKSLSKKVLVDICILHSSKEIFDLDFDILSNRVNNGMASDKFSTSGVQ